MPAGLPEVPCTALHREVLKSRRSEVNLFARRSAKIHLVYGRDMALFRCVLS